ncbi:MAG TPA: hypothetical protein VK527_02015 [Candidatus Limnocylindrales bacterium]|nr:hypothetical protein [Candidatus Limnocylindrales bacterium]
MATRERRDVAPGPSAPQALEWSVWPARRKPWAAAVLLASLAVLGALVAQGTGDRVLGVAAPLFILASVGSFIAKTEYRLTPESVEVRTLGVARVRPWGEMRRATVDRQGIFLSPFEKRSWLEAYRGVRLPFGGNRDQIVAFVESKLPVSFEDGEERGSGKRGRGRRPGAGAAAGG